LEDTTQVIQYNTYSIKLATKQQWKRIVKGIDNERIGQFSTLTHKHTQGREQRRIAKYNKKCQ